MKTIKLISILIICSLFAAACSAPAAEDETGLGTVSINFGGHSRAAVAPAERDTFTYIISIENNAGVSKELGKITGQGSASFSAPVGKWVLVVRGEGAPPSSDFPDVFPSTTLRALGESEITVSAGKTTPASVTMKPASEVTNAEQFTTAINFSADGETIVVKRNITLGTNPTTIAIGGSVNKNITLIAGGSNVTITVPVSFDVAEGSTLNLGKETGMKGSLTIDGNGTGTTAIVNVRGTLNMYDGITLKNRNSIGVRGGGVYVDEVGTFNMYGGTISGNTHSSPNNTSSDVHIYTGGTFNHYGGNKGIVTP